MARWGGPYPGTAYDAKDKVVDWADRTAVRRVVRWRVNGKQPQKSFGPGQKGHADALKARITAARIGHWEADGHGFPIDPSGFSDSAAASTVGGPDFATYTERVWEQMRGSWESKTRGQRRADMDLAIKWMVYPEGDDRLAAANREVGDSILLAHITAEDVERVMSERRRHNFRTRAANERAQAKWLKACDKERLRAARSGRKPKLPPRPKPRPEKVTDRTIQSFGVTVGMVLIRAYKAQLLPFDVWSAVHHEKAAQERVTKRTVPSIQETEDPCGGKRPVGTHPAGRSRGEPDARPLRRCAPSRVAHRAPRLHGPGP